MTVFSAVGKEKGPCLRPSLEMESCTCQVDRVTSGPGSACPVPVPAGLVGGGGGGSLAKVPRGLQIGRGAQSLEGLGAASSPSSPAPEEPRLARNVNKEETALAEQRLRDNSWPKQSSQAPTFIRKQARPLCAHTVIIACNYPSQGCAGAAGGEGVQLEALALSGVGAQYLR